jgi:hypothetical protein
MVAFNTQQIRDQLERLSSLKFARQLIPIHRVAVIFAAPKKRRNALTYLLD